jgi:hypothetical protein
VPQNSDANKKARRENEIAFSSAPAIAGEDAKSAARKAPDACFRLTIDLQ